MNTSLPDKYRAVNLSDIVESRPNVDEGSAYPPETVAKTFRKVVEERGDLIALTSCQGVTYSWKQYYENAHMFARALLANNLKPFETVTVLGFNAPEYMFTALGCIEAGGIVTGIYATNGPDACHYVMEHCGSAIAVVDGKHQFTKILEIRNRLPNLRMIVIYNYDNSFTIPADEEGVAKVRSWNDFLAMGSSQYDEEIDSRVNNQQPGQCISLIYTSGTTGNPKAVMISNDNVCFVARVIQEDFHIDCNDRIVSFLPLSHIAAQMIDIFAAMVIGFHIFYARPDALKGSLVETLRSAKPTIFVTVPRVFEKMMETINNTLEQASSFKQSLFAFCCKYGNIHCNNLQVGTKKQNEFLYCIANIILKKIRQKLGLECARLLFSAAATIELKTLQFFATLGIPIFEIFGMSESSGPCSFHTIGKWKIGTVGQGMRGSIVKTVPGTNEIILSGRHIFMGYLKMPEETLRAIDDDGFLHSGDCGECDADGFWKITGRIKELIVTAGGENIPPVLIESQLKALAPAISNAVLIGDKRKYLTVLITLQCRVAGDSGGKEGELIGESLKLVKQLGSSATTIEEAGQDPKILEYIQGIINEYNQKAFSNAQK